MKNAIIKGTLYLTLANFISRIFGFLYRIFLSNLIGAKGMGIFQLIFPVLSFCIALSCGGIQIAVSRFVAESKNAKERFYVFISSLVISAFSSLLVCGLLFHFSNEVSLYIIKNSVCVELLKYASITIPLTALHSCVGGYYLGLKKTFIPAATTILEQITKMIALLVLATVWIDKGIEITPLIAVYSMIISEAIGAGFCLSAMFAEKFFKIQLMPLWFHIKQLFSVSYILTANRILLTFLQCAEAILLPLVLVKSGLSEDISLEQYGILTGMALPLITFPSAISNSLGTMILPTIAEANTCNDPDCIKSTSQTTIWFSLITGIFSVGLFMAYGDFMGQYVFSQADASYYIKALAWLCPFLYLSITLGSILHGLGKTTAAFIHNLAGILLRLSFLWFLVPMQGITAYLLGLLISNILIVILHSIYIYRSTAFTIDVKNSIIKPTAWLLVSLTVGKLINFIFSFSDYKGKLFAFISNGTSLVFVVIVFLYFFLREIKLRR